MKELLIVKKTLISWLWLLSLLSILIKSNMVLISMYSFNRYIFIYNIYSIMPILFVISFYLVFSHKGQFKYLFGVNLFISLIFLVDMVYARAFGHLISIYMLFAKGVTEDLSSSVLSLIKWTDFLMFIDLPFIYSLIKRQQNSISHITQRFFRFSIAIFLSVSFIYYQFIDLEKNKGLGNIRLEPLLMSPLGAHMFDGYRFIYDKEKELDNEEINRVNNWLLMNGEYHNPDKKYANLEGMINGKNIIVVQFESLENSVVGESYYGQEITPNINRLLTNSIYFNNIYEQVRDGNSSDAELLFNTSIYPISNGSAFLRFGDNTYNSLPNLLNYRGYTSVAIHGDDKEFWNRNRVFPAMGFNRFIAEDEFDNKSKGGMGILDESLFAQSFLEIKKLKEPYYLFIITLTSHMPFNAAENIGHLELANDDITSRYLQTINYTDKVLGEFYAMLAKNGLLDNTVIIIYGDHEGLHKYYPTTLPNNNKEIPFIIHVPGMEGMIIDKVGGQVDMMPTLAYLLEIDKERYVSGVMGRNLFGDHPGAVILPDNNIYGKVEDEQHLREAEDIANTIIKGNFFDVGPK